jgi:hypothetical protein
MLKNQRMLENLHIPLWIIKDTCWMMQFKTIGTIMVFPTLAVAIYIVYYTRKSAIQLWPNLAVLGWIGANSIWMLGEFFLVPFQWLSFVFFIGGLVAMIIYFIKQNALKTGDIVK